MRVSLLTRRLAEVLFIFFTPSVLSAQETRAAEIEAQRAEKAKSLKPEETSPLERKLVMIREKRVLEKFQYGWHGLRFIYGGLPVGQGFAFGGQYLNDELADGNLVFHAAARASLRKADRMELGLAMPGVRQFFFGDIGAAYQQLPQVQYYGPGNDSHKTGRSDYRLETTFGGGTFGIKPFSHMRIGALGGYLAVNVGPGTRKQWANTELTYSPAQAPGVDHQTDYVQVGAFAQFDNRDNPLGPRAGGNYLARFTDNRDQVFSRYSFRRVDLEAQQYIHFFNQRRVLALRGRSVTTYNDRGQITPFYMQPTLGGSDDLRGYRPYRFYDNNSIIFNAEYRYEVFAGLDMALFADAGKVYRDHSNFDLDDMKTSYGFGFRFNARNNVFLRVDTGFSREGWQVWFKFNNIF